MYSESANHNKTSLKKVDRDFSSRVDKFAVRQQTEKKLGNPVLNFSIPLRRSSSLSEIASRPIQENLFGQASSKKKKFRSASFSSSSLLQFNGTKIEVFKKQNNSVANKPSFIDSKSYRSRAQAKFPHFVCTDNPASIRSLFFHNLQLKLHLIPLLPAASRLRMGQTLSEPVTKKESSSDENHSLKVGASCMQGWRINMEDEHIYKLCLNDEKDMHYFAVFDGHGGQAAAQYASKQLDLSILGHSAFKRGDIISACKGGFLTLDESLSKESLKKEDSSGCTAVSVIIKGNKIYCANVGDSRAVASVRGHAQLLSFDHKPNHERELKRIKAAGGFVEFNRVNGNLALSRALGDFNFKRNEQRSAEEQIVTADPDVIVKDITNDHEFIVIACDGIWDVLSNQDVVEFVREKLGQKVEPDQICEDLMDKCLAGECAVGGVGCDNMTVIIIALKQAGSFEELCQKCKMPKRDPIPPSCLLPSYPDYVRGGISCL